VISTHLYRNGVIEDHWPSRRQLNCFLVLLLTNKHTKKHTQLKTLPYLLTYLLTHRPYVQRGAVKFTTYRPWFVRQLERRIPAGNESWRSVRSDRPCAAACSRPNKHAPDTTVIQSGAEKLDNHAVCKHHLVYVSCCSTMVSFLQNVDARDRIRRR